MTDIPRARRLIADAYSQIDQALMLLQEAQDLMTRPSPIRRAKTNSAKVTPTLARRIRVYAQAHPSTPYKAIGAHYNVDIGRVSEVLRDMR